MADCTNESGVIADYLEDDSFGKLLSSPNQMVARNSSPKVKKHPLDLSPEHFFMTSNEMNGKCLLVECHSSGFMYIKLLLN